MGYPVERTDPRACIVRCDQVKTGWTWRAYWLSDLHWDSIHCQRDALKYTLDEARAHGAPIFLIGDVFDLMQGPGDKRGRRSEIREEFRGADDYGDAVLDAAIAWFAPYADQIALLSEGNHEWGYEKYHASNLTKKLAKALGAQHFTEWGFVRFQFERPGGGNRTSRTCYFHHINTGGPVTKGVIGAARRDQFVQACDFLFTGHNHERTAVDAPFVDMNAAGTVEMHQRVHLNMGTWKEEFLPSGYHSQMARPPKPIGGWILDMRYDARKPGYVGVTPIPTD